jgi:monovalent cation:H+ antiporter-2, CPA2 family
MGFFATRHPGCIDAANPNLNTNPEATTPKREHKYIRYVTDSGLILTLAGGLSTALVLGYLTQRIGLSPIAGYLIAGIVVGPHSPGFVANGEYAEQLAEVGIILLMFGVGLQFHAKDLIAMRRTAIPGALAGVIAATAAGAVGAHAVGWPWLQAAVFGLTLSVASTVVLIRILSDTRQLHTRAGHVAVAWLVLEDILTVLVLVILPTLAAPTLSASVVASGIAFALVKVIALALIAIPVGGRVVPRILDRIAATRSRELFTLSVLVLALGIAVAAAVVFGVSIALGAFVAGLVVGRSEYSVRAMGDALPMRDAFAVLFFVSVGMLLDPVQLTSQMGLLFVALAVVVLIKPVVAMTMLLVLGHPLKIALTVPAALAQIGEFSFILANLGRELRLLPAEATNVVVAVSIISIVLNPIGARLVPRAERLLSRLTFRAYGSVTADDEGAASSLVAEDRAVVIGNGPTGQIVSRLLRENGIAPTIVEMNIDAVRNLRRQNESAVYGDARAAETLISAGIRHAGTLIVSAAMPESTEVVARAKELNPKVSVLARANYLLDLESLQTAGAEEAFSGEGEVALAMTEAVLLRLGASRDQVDRERARVRRELFGGG